VFGAHLKGWQARCTGTNRLTNPHHYTDILFVVTVLEKNKATLETVLFAGIVATRILCFQGLLLLGIHRPCFSSHITTMCSTRCSSVLRKSSKEATISATHTHGTEEHIVVMWLENQTWTFSGDYEATTRDSSLCCTHLYATEH
jgi:hypothetical protein